MATTTTSPAAHSRVAEILEQSEQMETALRETAVAEIHENIDEFLHWATAHTDLRQILTLRDILMWTNSHDRNVLTGVAVVLGRKKPAAVFVNDDDLEPVEKFIEALADVDTKGAEWARRMSLTERILKLSRCTLEEAEWALNAVEGDRGCGTPEEEFVTSVLRLYGRMALEPRELNGAIVKLRDDLKDVATDAAHMAKRFPNGYDPDTEWPVFGEEETA